MHIWSEIVPWQRNENNTVEKIFARTLTYLLFVPSIIPTTQSNVDVYNAVNLKFLKELKFPKESRKFARETQINLQ